MAKHAMFRLRSGIVAQTRRWPRTAASTNREGRVCHERPTARLRLQPKPNDVASPDSLLT